MVDARRDAHGEAMGLGLRFDGVGGHGGDGDGDSGVRGGEVAPLVHAHLGRVREDDVERHILQDLDSVFPGGNKRLLRHIRDVVPSKGKGKSK